MASLFSRKKYEIPTYQSAVASTQWKPQQNMSVAPQFATKTPNYSQGLFSSASRVPQNTINTNLMSREPNMSYNDPKRFDLNPTPLPKPQAPAPKVNPMAQYTARIDDYFNRMSDQSAQRVAQEEANRQKEQEFTAQRYGLMNDAIRGAIPNLQNTFNTFKGNTQAAIADTVAQGEAQKEQARDYFGEATKTAAQARKETQQQATQKFASQGAVDSAGAGSYRQANENIDSDFNSYIQKNSKELAYKLTDIDSAIGQYQREASALIQGEEAKLMESLRQIEFQLADNEIAKNQAIQQVYSQYQDRINGIQDTLSAIEQQGIEQKNNIAMELEKLNQTTLSPEFMATGVPTTQAEYEFMVANGDKMKDLGLTGGGQASNASKADIISLIDNTLQRDLGVMSGIYGKTGIGTMWGEGLSTKAYIDQIKSKLSLEEREKLRGTGTITDKETEMLENSVAKLVPGMPKADLEQELREIKNILGGNYRYAGDALSLNQSFDQVSVVGPNGERGTMNSAELQEALANGWRRA